MTIHNWLWVEKYRPSTVDTIVGHPKIKRLFLDALTTKNIPHLLLFGSPGTGKTSAILALCSEYFPKDIIKNRVLELNASDERGIDVIRSKIKVFSQQVISDTPYAPPFKVIILDESDSLTQDAQNALRRIIEDYSQNTRFCLICNNISKIIDPISSRCSRLLFKPLNAQIISSRLANIVKTENIHLNEDIITYLSLQCGGDMRKAITQLQSIVCISDGTDMSLERVQYFLGVVPEHFFEEMFSVLQTTTTQNLYLYIKKFIINEGWMVWSFIRGLQKSLINYQSIDDVCRAFIMKKLGETETRLLDGANEELQILSLLFYFRMVFQKKLMFSLD